MPAYLFGSVHLTANLYHLVFRLPESTQEPDHYELLGVTRFSESITAIRDAAVRRQSELLKWQNFDDQSAIERLQDEVILAIQTLEQPDKKRDYDIQLQAKLGLASEKQDATAATNRRVQQALGKSIQPTRKPSLVVNSKPVTQEVTKAGEESVTATASETKSVSRETTAPEWFARSRKMKQVPTDEAIIVPPGFEHQAPDSPDDVPARADAPRNRTASDRRDSAHIPTGRANKSARETRIRQRRERETRSDRRPHDDKQTNQIDDATLAISQPSRFWLGRFTETTETIAGQMFLAFASVEKAYGPVEQFVFRHLFSLRALLLGLLLMPIRIWKYVFGPLVHQQLNRNQIALIAPSAWIRIRAHEAHPWVNGSSSRTHIHIPDRCVECNKTAKSKPKIELFDIYDQQSVGYLFLLGILLALGCGSFVGGWMFDRVELTGWHFAASVVVTFLAAILVMRPFVRARRFTISSTTCSQHKDSPYPLVTMQNGHIVLHVGSRELQREFDAEWVFEKKKPR